MKYKAYEQETGIDLFHDTIQSVSAEMTELMEIGLSLKRMDSLMVESNIKTIGHLELFYTCVANLVKGRKDFMIYWRRR